MVSEVFEKRINNRLIDNQEKCGLFLISIMVLGLLDQLQIFWQLYLIELLGVLTGLGLLELQFLMYPRLLTRFTGFTIHFMTFLMMLSVILLPMLMILLTNLSDQVSDLWQQLDMDLRNIVDWGRKSDWKWICFVRPAK